MKSPDSKKLAPSKNTHYYQDKAKYKPEQGITLYFF
jgi:hypothetical protein